MSLFLSLLVVVVVVVVLLLGQLDACFSSSALCLRGVAGDGEAADADEAFAALLGVHGLLEKGLGREASWAEALEQTEG